MVLNMSEYAYGIYEEIVRATSSDLILFFIIAAVAVIPLYMLALKGRKAEKEHERERDKQFLAVIKENSTVLAGLKITLDSNGTSTVSALERIYARIDNNDNKLATISENVSQVATNIMSLGENQRESISKLNKILLISSGGSLSLENVRGDDNA